MPLPRSEYLSAVWKDDLFKGKVVFCTGGNGTICSAEVRAMVHLGADACIVGRNEEKTTSMAKDIATARQGSKVLGIGKIDVRNHASLQNAVDECVKQLGGIDYLIAGAAGNFVAPMSQLSPNAFKSVIDIDVLGSFNVAKVALPHLVASAQKSKQDPTRGPGGRAIFISATFHYTGWPMQTHVAAAKAAVDALSNNIAVEYGPHGVTSNVIAPGPIEGTEGMKRLSTLSNTTKSGARTVPLQRMGTVKNIADATVYLFTDTGDYVNGEVLVVDGGAWRTMGTGVGDGANYPACVMTTEPRSKL